MIRVALIGDERTLKSLLVGVEDMHVERSQGDDINSIVEYLRQFEPDVVALDHHYHAINIEVLCSFVAHHLPHVHVILLTDENPDFELLKNTGYTARGFVTTSQYAILDKAVRAVDDGEAWLPRRLVAEMLNRFANLPTEAQ